MKLKTFILDNDRATDRGRDHWRANGYAVVNKDHPYYWKEVRQIERYLDVHWWVTFSNTLKQCKEKFSRIYEEYLKLEWTSEDDEVTIIWFDTFHYWDTKEEWDKEAVRKEAEILAEQLEKIK